MKAVATVESATKATAIESGCDDVSGNGSDLKVAAMTEAAVTTVVAAIAATTVLAVVTEVAAATEATAATLAALVQRWLFFGAASLWRSVVVLALR